MAKFGKASIKNLSECHPHLQEILNEAIKVMDFSVIEGNRSEEEQNKLFHKGMSKLKYPESKHNELPSLAADVAPYPIDWKDKDRFILLAGIIKGIAHAKGIKIRWGGDFNNNNIISDESFLDMPHVELVGVES